LSPERKSYWPLGTAKTIVNKPSELAFEGGILALYTPVLTRGCKNSCIRKGNTHVTATKGLVHQLADPNLSINQRAQLRCQLASQLEDEGDYEAARKALGELWHRVGERPLLDGLDEETKAAVLLRAGVLTGWIGSAKQITGAQETAKNLISESIAIFEALPKYGQMAEAQIDLACCYWREGAFDEGRVMLREAMSRLTDSDIELRAMALLRLAIIERTANRYNDALRIQIEAAPLFEEIESHALKGSFHNTFAIVLKNLGAAENRQDYIDLALIEYAAASYHFERAGHIRYQACVENNLAMLFWKANRFADAHERLDRAQTLFTRLKDTVHLAQVDETRARVLLGEGRVVDAEKTSRRAVRTLEKGDEQSLLAEALTTHGVSLARLQHPEQARSAFRRAIDGAQQAGDLESAGNTALTMIEELGSYLSSDDLSATLSFAKILLEKTSEIATISRLANCACSVLSLIDVSGKYPASVDWPNFSLEREVLRYEAHFIKLALKDTGGKVTPAAHLLGLPGHQALQFILNNRHKSLLSDRTPIVPRKRSLTGEQHRDHVSHSTTKTRTIKILHVEDNETVAGMVKETLENEGWRVEACADGAEALRRIKSDTHYDLLLLDYDLPGLNGIELLQQARALTHRRKIPVIVLSGTAVEQAVMQSGADAFLRKPEDISSVVEAIAQLLSPAAG
jgi:CheY-like chemotaxis protein